jgi:hypothetical protein
MNALFLNGLLMRHTHTFAKELEPDMAHAKLAGLIWQSTFKTAPDIGHGKITLMSASKPIDHAWWCWATQQIILGPVYNLQLHVWRPDHPGKTLHPLSWDFLCMSTSEHRACCIWQGCSITSRLHQARHGTPLSGRQLPCVKSGNA